VGRNKTIFRKTLNYTFIKKLFQFLNSWYLKVDHGPSIINSWFNEVERRVKHRGPIDTIAYIKGCRLAFTRFISGSPLTQSPHPSVGINKNGLPKGLPWLEILARGGVQEKRLAHSLLLASRFLPGSNLPSLETVTAPPVSISNDIIIGEARAVVKSLGWKVARPFWTTPHLSTKMGPNGQAMMGALADLSALTPRMKSLISLVGGQALGQWIETLSHFDLLTWQRKFGLNKKGNPLIHSKLSYVKDKEAKCRIIAILDYWSQSALKPLHESLFRLLKRIPGDCTFDQASFARTLPPEGPYHSLDLTAATDRFPLWFQRAVLAEVTSDEQYGSAWAELIANREFYVPWTGGRVFYSCGQPMGAYSSWAAFALAHHVVVRLAAKRAGLHPSFQSYALLGDDIVIASDSVAREYKRLLVELGVSISEQKSHVSLDTYEFAKRWMHRGEEMTGAPISQVLRFEKKPRWFVLAAWIREVESRWLRRDLSLASRRLLRELIALWGVEIGYADRLAFKALSFFNLPVSGEPFRVRLSKALWFSREFFKDIIGCNRGKFALTLMWEWLAEAKTGVLEDSLRSQDASVRKFLAELSSLGDLIPKGMDSQSALTSLVPVAAVLANLQDLQSQFDRLRSDFTSGRERRIVENGGVYQVCTDPTKVWSVRQSHKVLYSNASLVNKFRALATRYVEGRLNYISQPPIPEELALFRAEEEEALRAEQAALSAAQMNCALFSSQTTPTGVRELVVSD
jgi:hypothetical protein